MASLSIYISNSSVLHYWRTNPPWYVLVGAAPLPVDELDEYVSESENLLALV